MAAAELFERLLNGLGEGERQSLSDLINTARLDLFAARSEDARVRIVNAFIRTLHEASQQPSR